MKMRFQRHGRQFFFFTFCVEGRKPVLSRIVKGRGLCPRAPGSPTVGAAGGPGGSGGVAPRPLHGGGNAEVHTELLPAGEAIISVLKSLHARNPALTASDRVVMPDHVHFVLIVDFDKDPGFEPLVFAHCFMEETARDGGTAPEPPAATQGAAPEPPAATQGAAPEPPAATQGTAPEPPTATQGTAPEAPGARGAAPPVLWQRRFWLVLSFSARQLSAIRHYIRHNPARAVWKAEHPDRFARMAGFRHPILDSALRWSACGDLTLIGSPFLFPVRLTRRLPVEAQEEAIAEAVERAESGMIPVCGFISPAEKELQQRLRASSHTRWIKMVPHGLPPRYDPSVEDSRAFAEGRLLVLSSFPPEIPVSPISRENCELMNARILKLCGPAAEPINTSHCPFREQSPFRGLGGKPPSFERLAMKHILPAITLSAALLAGCSKTASDTAHTLADVPLPVRTLSVTNAPFERAMTVQGTLEAVESATVSARIPGPLSEVCVDLGDKVVAGETKLFAVDSATVSNQVVIAREAAATARAHVAVAEANVAKAEAVAKKAVRDAERFARLHGEDRVTDNEWERAQTQRETAEADVAVAKASLQLARQQVSQAEAQLSIAERQLADATLYAPCDGIVAARFKEPGEQVGPGTPVVVVKGVKELKALAFLPAKHYAEVIPGETKVQVQTGARDGGMRPPSPPVETTVVAKSPAIDQRLRVFEIKALLPGSDAAVPGAMADFHVVFERREGVSVPQEAVLSRAAGTVVFVTQPDGTAKEVPVRVGLRDSGRAEILEGLALGDPVIVQGQSQLYDGRKIEVK